MPKVYDPILCMMVDKPAKARDVTKDAISNVKVGSKYKINGKEYKVIRANISQNIVSLLSDNFERLDMKFDEFTKKANDSASALDKAIRAVDVANLKELKDDYGRLKNASSIIGNIYSLSSSTKSAIIKAIESGMREIDTRIDRAYMK